MSEDKKPTIDDAERKKGITSNYFVKDGRMPEEKKLATPKEKGLRAKINQTIKGLSCDETCANNPESCAKERYAIRVLERILDDN